MNDIIISKNVASVLFRGGICVVSAKEENTDNQLLVFGDADRIEPPGKPLGDYIKKEGMGVIDVFPRHVALKFKYKESIDVVIAGLKRLRKNVPKFDDCKDEG